MALGGAAWRNETRAWRRAMLKTPRPNTDSARGGVGGDSAPTVRPWWLRDVGGVCVSRL